MLTGQWVCPLMDVPPNVSTTPGFELKYHGATSDDVMGTNPDPFIVMLVELGVIWFVDTTVGDVVSGAVACCVEYMPSPYVEA